MTEEIINIKFDKKLTLILFFYQKIRKFAKN